MRRLIDFLIYCYLLPLRLSARLAIYVKGKILQYDEHYLVALNVIKRQFPDANGIIIDVGAYDADSAIYFAKAMPYLKVIGFEPNPVPFRRAVVNSQNYKNIEIHNLGFFDKPGEVDFYLTKDDVSSSLFDLETTTESEFDSKIKVRVDTLDSYFKTTDEILLIKLDVQGAELSILKCGTETLGKTKMVLTEMLIADLYRGGCHYYELDEVMRRNGFTLHTLFSNYNNEGAKYFDALYLNTNRTIL